MRTRIGTRHRMGIGIPERAATARPEVHRRPVRATTGIHADAHGDAPQHGEPVGPLPQPAGRWTGDRRRARAPRMDARCYGLALGRSSASGSPLAAGAGLGDVAPAADGAGLAPAATSWHRTQVSSPRRAWSMGSAPTCAAWWQARHVRFCRIRVRLRRRRRRVRLVAQPALVLVAADHARRQVGDLAVAGEAGLVELGVGLGDRRPVLGDLVAVEALRLGDAHVARGLATQRLVRVAGQARRPALELVPDRRDRLEVGRAALLVAQQAAVRGRDVGEPHLHGLGRRRHVGRLRDLGGVARRDHPEPVEHHGARRAAPPRRG